MQNSPLSLDISQGNGTASEKMGYVSFLAYVLLLDEATNVEKILLR
jgi:hypothetical protein